MSVGVDIQAAQRGLIEIMYKSSSTSDAARCKDSYIINGSLYLSVTPKFYTEVLHSHLVWLCDDDFIGMAASWLD